MQGFFAAKHVAVFGVSTRPDNLGQRILNNLLNFGYPGRITLIGRSGGALAGHIIRPSLDDISEQVDLAVVLTPAPTIADIFQQCIRNGVKRIVVESGGFNELGQRGEALAQELRGLAAEHNLRFIGPNGIGVVDNYTGLAVPFSVMPKPPRGTVSVITQSGGIGLLYANFLVEEGLGMSKFVSMGNKLNVDENDLIPFLADDDSTSVVLAYLESIPDGRRLFEALRACHKPVVVHKSNISSVSADIAGSHTAALVNDDAVVSAALRQAVAVRTDRLADTIAAVKAFMLPPMRGDRVVVVSRSGGHAIIAADECYKAGMKFAELPRAFFRRVRKSVRADVIRLGNPLDLGDVFDVEAYLQIMTDVMALPGVDGVIFLFVYLSAYEHTVPERIVDRAEELSKKHGRPMALVLHTWPEEMARMKRYTQFPIFDTAEEAVAALAEGRERWKFLQKAPKRTPRVKKNPAAENLLAAAEPGSYLRQDRAFELLDCYGIEHPPVVLAATARQAVEAARAWKNPSLAMKVESPQAVHKTDVGGIMLGIEGPANIRKTFGRLQRNLEKHVPRAEFAGALVMPMARRGLEFIAGFKRDDSFGPVVLLGWGGTAAEAMETVSLRLAPITMWEARQMIDELPGQKLLDSFRGRPPINRASMARLLVKLSQLAQLPQISEIDLNPVRVYHDGALALDVRVKIE